ncbi:uncharacterized protein Tco025E_06402 [Trypanosoma conorhini]|uniref:WW domain-containing protein n=1 Tax=Trypanosoma conorhini TaxID=83891 RepID=A0A3R7KPE2_9TRYP|nr:uncharacterized protein Tco025E_06402 [Trypanosoma conorhini]RNF12839.1 hypothetical protein Tco025E_06402 [Trypanosoma conorhini]
MAVIPKAGEVFHGDDGSVSVVLPDPCDPNSVPTQEEVEEYAEWLGIDVEREPGLLWIAREGLRRPLPAEWKACRTGEGEVYYFNFLTGDSKWEHPTDEAFKEKVVEERAKLMAGEAGHGKAKKRNKASSAGAGRGEEGLEGRRLEKGAAGHFETPKRFMKGSKGSAATTPMTSPYASPTSTGLTASAMRFGRLGALGTPAATQRVTPDVSGLLMPSNAGDRALTRFGFGGTNTSTSGLGLAAAGLGGGVAAGKLSLPKTHDGVKEMEAQICRRIDDDIEARRRDMRIRHEKQIMEESAALEKALQDAKDAGECAVAAARERQAKELEQRAQAELMSLQRTLEQQQAEANVRVASLRQKLELERASLAAALQERLKEVRSETQLRRSESARKQREAAAATLAKEKARLAEDLARQLEEEAATLERDRKKNLEAFEEGLAAERAKLVQELGDSEEEQGGAAEAEAQLAYEAALQKATSAAAGAMEDLRREYRAKEEELQSEKQKKLQEKEASAAAVAAEAAQLQRAVERKLAEYAAETQRLVAARQAEVSETRPAGAGVESRGQSSGRGNSSNNNNDAAKPGLSGATVAQEQRRFDFASRSLETKHAQSMDRIRREHERTLQEKKLFNPRQSPGYAERLREEQKLWLRANPPPALTMPQLEPVPTLSGMMNASPVPMPSEAEQQRRIDIAVTDAKERRAAEDENRLAEVELALAREMKEAVAAHRERRLQEVEAELTRYQERQAEECRQRLDRTAAAIAEEAKAPPLASQPEGNNEKPPLVRLNEVSEEEAQRREGELRQRWQGRIATLEETTRRACADLRQRQEEAQQQARTPAAATPANTANTAVTANATSTAVAFQRPPTVPIDAFLPGRQEQQLTPRPSQQQQQIHSSTTPLMNCTLSTIAPANSLWSSARPSPTKQHPWLTAGNATPSAYWPESQAALGRDGSCEKASPTVPSKQNLVLEDRLYRASLLLRERKEKLRAQQARMERAREAWRRDMAECRSRRDRNHASFLREVKVALEEKARQLNREVVDLKQTTAWLRKRMAQYKETLSPQLALRAPAADASEADNTAVAGSSRIISLLEGILAHTELLESYVAATKQPGTRSPSHTRRRSASPEQRHGDHHEEPTPSWKNATTSGVTRWLVEQQLPSSTVGQRHTGLDFC